MTNLAEERRDSASVQTKGMQKRSLDLAHGDAETSAGKRPPYPKRKVAILMGYCGTAYQGMQLYHQNFTITTF